MLEIPQILLRPSLDDIQQILNKGVQTILKSSQDIYEWKIHPLIYAVTIPGVDDHSKGNHKVLFSSPGYVFLLRSIMHVL